MTVEMVDWILKNKKILYYNHKNYISPLSNLRPSLLRIKFINLLDATEKEKEEYKKTIEEYESVQERR